MLRLAIYSLLASFVAITPLFAENWPQWRGPENDGISHEKNIPTKWSATENIAWTCPMPGIGSSTPAVWGDKIFLTSQADSDLVLMCISTAGKELWRKTVGTGAKKALIREDEGNSASASPSTDGKHVFAFVGSGNLACFDFDGKEIWNIDVQKLYGNFRIQFGMHSTPVLYKDRLYLQLLHDGGQLVIALNKADGSEAWKISRKSDGRAECLHSYASPVMWHKGDRALFLVHGNDYTTAHDLKDGSEVWRVGDLNPKAKYNATLRFVASPVATPDLIVIPTAKNGAVVGVKPDGKGIVIKGNSAELWRKDKGTPDVPSPLANDGLVYLCRERGESLTCFDALTGNEYYSQPLHKERYRASPLYADSKIYCAARDGVVSVVKAGKQFELLAENKVPDTITACLAVSEGRIYIRGWKNLYAVGK